MRKINRILFVRVVSSIVKNNFHVRNPKPPLNFGYVISLLEKEDYETNFIDMMVDNINIDHTIQKTIKYNPDSIVVSCMSHDADLCLDYSRKIKKLKNIPIIVVGQHASYMPNSLVFENSPIDYLLIGEFEMSVFDLFKKINKNEYVGKLKNLYSNKKHSFKPGIVKDLDDLPFPKHKLFIPKKYVTFYPVRINKKLKWGYIETSRGCPHSCIFCSPTVRESYGNKLRFRNPKRVVDEIEYLIEKGRNIISFMDDNFTTSKKHMAAICNEILRRKLKISWIAQGRVDEVDKKILKLIKESGCVNLRFGIESGSNRIIKILKKTNKKIDWVEQTKKVFRYTKKIDLPATALFLIGSPMETEKDIERTMKLIEEIEPEMIQICYLTPYLGSEAFEIYKDLINKEDFWEIYHYSSPILNVSLIPSKKLNLIHRRFYRSYFLKPKFLINHYLHYSGYYLFNSKVWLKLLKMIIFHR